MSDSDIKRLVPVIREAGLPITEKSNFQGKTVLITLDQYGFSEKIAAAVKAQQGKVIGIIQNNAIADNANAGVNNHLPNAADNANAGANNHLPNAEMGKTYDFCDEIVTADFSSDDAAMASAEKIIQHCPEPDAFLHLAPLDLCFSTKPEEKISEQHVKSFFLMLKQMYKPLNQPGKLIAALSINSVLFPHTQSSEILGANIEPCFAGIAGMMKSIAKEMPDTRVKMVDFVHAQPNESLSPQKNMAIDDEVKNEIVKYFLNEITSQDPRVETGYQNGRKYVMHLEEQTCKKDTPLIKSGDCLLVTGGARGITFEILKKLVQQYKTDLVIMARSSIDDIDAEFLAESADEAWIMANLKQSMTGVKPIELKKAAARILSIKESRENIDLLKSHGISVTYIAADVADREAVIQSLSQFDRVDGVIHAAGLEESMPFEKKMFDSFLRVFNTKVQGCQNVIKALEGKGVRFHVGFSSVTAKFGNEGQADYTAANDMLAKILLREQALHPEVTCKIMDWTAWSGAGMATRETVQKVLKERGLKFLPLNTGINFFMDEMEESETAEVVLTGLDHAFDRDGLLSIAPFLDSVEENDREMTVFSRHLSIDNDLFLLDHAMEGIPIFLGATGVETMAEAAMTKAVLELKDTVPSEKKGRDTDAAHLVVSEIKNFSIPYGIKLLQNRPKDIIISVTQGTPAITSPNTQDTASEDNQNRQNEYQCIQNEYKCSITSQFVNPAGVTMGDPKLHYQCDVVITQIPPDKVKIPHKENSITVSESKQRTIPHEPEKRIIPQFISLDNSKSIAELIYHPQRLFMDGIFKTIHDILSFDGTTLVTKIGDRSRAVFFSQDPSPCFLTDVALLDGMFQTGGVFEFLTDSAIVLPYKIGSLKFFSRGVKDMDYLCLTTRTASNDETDTFNIDLVDEEGNCLMELVDFQMVKLHKLPENLRITPVPLQGSA